VRATVGSVLRQTRGDFELLVWDDGSTDGSAEAALSAANGDPRVRVIRAQHQGFSRSLKAATAAAAGEYLGWVDSDDALAPRALEQSAAVLDALPSVGMVYTQYATMDENGRVLGLGIRCQTAYSSERLLVDFMTFHFRLIRRSVFDAVGGIDEDLPLAQDYDLCLRLSEVTEVAHLPEPLYFYRLHEGAVSRGHDVQQIYAASAAIERALVRRGLAPTHEIDLEIVGRFELRRKPAARPHDAHMLARHEANDD
jgi:glycosyltransferase involved in cell wall biosynthesis